MRTTKLEKLSACREAIEWVKGQKSPEEAWQNCHRGDWMLWIAKRLDVDDRLLTLAKATCANQVRHLMTDQRSIDALDASFRYAKGELTREELNTYASSAAYASYASDAAAHAASASSAYAYAAAADAAAAAAASSAYAYAYAASASYASYAYSAAYAASTSTSAGEESLKKSADICREILTDVVLIKYKKL